MNEELLVSLVLLIFKMANCIRMTLMDFICTSDSSSHGAVADPTAYFAIAALLKTDPFLSEPINFYESTIIG